MTELISKDYRSSIIILKLRCDDRFTHAFTALPCIFRVEIAKGCSFQPIEKFLLKTQNAAAFKVSQRKTAT